MTARDASPYADAMVSAKSEEHAALVALLQARAPALIDLPGQVTLASAAEDVRSWATQGYRHTFLMRNATMSGYGLATVVVEAGEKSGARSRRGWLSSTAAR